jgi:hypothetical protein
VNGFRVIKTIMIAVLLAAVALASSSAGSVPRYSAKLVGNSASGGRVAEHQFYVGDGYAGVFRDNRHARTRYRVCLYRGAARLSCKSGRTGHVGVDDSVFLIAPQQPGDYVYRWLVAGRPVVSWSVNIGVGD